MRRRLVCGVEHAALGLDAVGLARDADKNADDHLLVLLDLLEVDMEIAIADRVALDFLQEGDAVAPASRFLVRSARHGRRSP